MSKDYLKDLSPGSQCYKVMQYMQRYGSITPAEAFIDLGVYRLSGRIHNLRSIGIPIATDMVEKTMADGSTKRFARYYIDEERSMGA